MSILVVYASMTGNTRKVAEAIAQELGIQAVDIRKEPRPNISGVDLLFVGSGVYAGRPARRIRDFLRGIPNLTGVKAAVFGTYGAKPKQLAALERLLKNKGAQVVDQFACPGRDWFTLGLLHRHRPNEADLHAARAFARQIAGLRTQDAPSNEECAGDE